MSKEVSGEFELIDKIKESFMGLVPAGTEGIGDDAAVIPCGDGESFVVTTDMLVEGVHFMRDAISPRELGGKSLSVNLSDVAAMGVSPVASFLSIALPKDVDENWRMDFMDGYKAVSERYSTPLLGGDTTSSDKGVIVNVTVLGRGRDENIKLRSVARPGDAVCVTGYLGDSAAGLKILLSGCAKSDFERILIERHHNPRPHIEEGKWLGARAEVTSMMDVSDGVASDLRHIMELSGVGAVVDVGKLPVSQEAREVSAERKWNMDGIALSGGEDYVLLFTVAGDALENLKVDFAREFGAEPAVIGEITDNAGHLEWFKDDSRLTFQPEGFTHF